MNFHRIEILFSDCGLKKDLPILAGISGGTDSLALLHLLVEAGFLVTGAHFDHQIQQNSSTGALFVKDEVEKLGCSFILGTADVKKIAEMSGESLEATARNERYRFLFDSAEKISAQAVLTGHTADDQVETILMHILRGSGIRGLAGMKTKTFLRQFSTSIPLIRPLLHTSRAYLDEYCRSRNLHPWIDPSNQDTTFTRNRIRQELIPFLGTYNPQIKRRILSLGEAVQGAMEFLESSLEDQYQEVYRGGGVGYRAFDRTLISAIPAGARNEIIFKVINDLLPAHEDIDQAAILRATELLTKSNDLQVDLANRLMAITTGDRFYIAQNGALIIDQRYPQMVQASPLILEIPGFIKLAEDWCLYSAIMPQGWTPGLNELSQDPLSVFIDRDALDLPLMVRARLSGDRFQPIGMAKGTIKLSDFFTNEKIPARWRDLWPLVVSANQIVWVAGQQIGDRFKITSTCHHIVKLWLKHDSNKD